MSEDTEKTTSSQEKAVLDQRWAAFLADPSIALTLDQFKELLASRRR